MFDNTRYYSELIEKCELGYALIDQEYHFLDFNQALLDLMNCSASEIINFDLLKFIDLEKHEIFKKKTRQIDKNSKNISLEIAVKPMHGRILPVQIQIVLIGSNEEDAVGYALVFREIAAQKKIEKELIEKNKRIISHINTYDRISTGLFCCSSVEQVFSVIKEYIRSLLPESSMAILSTEQKKYVILQNDSSIIKNNSKLSYHTAAIMEKLILQPEIIYLNNIKQQFAEADYKYFPGLMKFSSAFFLPLKVENKLFGVIILSFNKSNVRVDRSQLHLLRGITNLGSLTIEKLKYVKEQEQMQLAIDRYERLTSMGRIIAGVAHEINNPLSIMQFDLEELAETISHSKEDRTDERDIIKSMTEEIARITSIVRQLKDYANPYDKKIDKIIIDDVLKMHPLKIMIKNSMKKGIEITLNLRAPNHYIEIPKSRIIQVLMNLLSNAEDAVSSIENPNIIIDTSVIEEKCRSCLCIKICDNGMGISQETQQLIFEPFFTTKKGEGTGLGLSISYSIIQSYNGSISVESVPGQGTAFKILFPALNF